jgi:hypothetical protein
VTEICSSLFARDLRTPAFARAFTRGRELLAAKVDAGVVVHDFWMDVPEGISYAWVDSVSGSVANFLVYYGTKLINWESA